MPLRLIGENREHAASDAGAWNGSRPIIFDEHDRTLAAARAGLSSDEFTSAFTTGTKMTLDEAVQYARATNLDSV
jgi:hypothetical protein